MSEFEVEKKYAITDKEKLSNKLNSYEIKDKNHLELDIVYLFGINDFKNFKPGDAVMRIRQKDKKSTLTMKKQLNLTSNLEIESDIADLEAMGKILQNIGFMEVVRVKKMRTTYSIQGTEVCFDSVEDLGNFVEIEVLCSKNEQKNAIKKIDNVAQLLGLTEEMIETRKYDTMMKLLKKENK